MTFRVRCNTFSMTHWKIPGADEALKGKWVKQAFSAYLLKCIVLIHQLKEVAGS